MFKPLFLGTFLFSISRPLCVTTYPFLFPTLKIIILWDKNAFKNNTQNSFINVILSIVLLLELRFENRNIYLVGTYSLFLMNLKLVSRLSKKQERMSNFEGSKI